MRREGRLHNLLEDSADRVEVTLGECPVSLLERFCIERDKVSDCGHGVFTVTTSIDIANRLLKEALSQGARVFSMQGHQGALEKCVLNEIEQDRD